MLMPGTPNGSLKSSVVVVVVVVMSSVTTMGGSAKHSTIFKSLRVSETASVEMITFEDDSSFCYRLVCGGRLSRRS